MEPLTSTKRISKAEILSLRRTFNGATKRYDSAVGNLKKIDKELGKKPITSTRRKILSAQRIQRLGERDAANVDKELSKQRLNSHLDHNKKINSDERKGNSKAGKVKLRVGKLSFTLQTFFKSAALPADSKDKIVSAIQKDDTQKFRDVLAVAIKNNSKIKVRFNGVPDEVSGPLLVSMMKWFKSRYDIAMDESSVEKVDSAPGITPEVV